MRGAREPPAFSASEPTESSAAAESAGDSTEGQQWIVN